MANANEIGRSEPTPSVGSTKDRKRFTDFGASARREDGRLDGGSVFELAARIEGDKAKVLSQAAKEMGREARKALESAARSGIQPPAWVQAIMSKAGRRALPSHRPTIWSPGARMHHPAPGSQPRAHKGAVGFYMDTIQELEVIRDDGQAYEWAALVINGEEIVPAGRLNWLRFVWLSQRLSRKTLTNTQLFDNFAHIAPITGVEKRIVGDGTP